MPKSRAIVFDLDDTLYPYSAFVRSGFRAVSRRLAQEYGLPLTGVLRVLRRALVGSARGRELQMLCERYDLPGSMVPSLVALIREHRPSLRLPRASARVLSVLRPTWSVAVLTNGSPDIQRRKIAALGLSDLVDEVLFAAECGDGAGKPAASAFCAALDRLHAIPEATVFVGDDPEVDIAGAAAVGMKTIQVAAHGSVQPDGRVPGCGIHVGQLDLVPAMANQLVPVRTHCHVS